jgi:hypothetical protein
MLALAQGKGIAGDAGRFNQLIFEPFPQRAGNNARGQVRPGQRHDQRKADERHDDLPAHMPAKRGERIQREATRRKLHYINCRQANVSRLGQTLNEISLNLRQADRH